MTQPIPQIERLKLRLYEIEGQIIELQKYQKVILPKCGQIMEALEIAICSLQRLKDGNRRLTAHLEATQTLDDIQRVLR